MDPPPLRNGSRASVEVLPHFSDRDGAYVGIVLIKERFAASRDGVVRRAGGAEVKYADELWNPKEPETSSIRLPSDMCLSKPSTDVLVLGEARAPYRESVRQLDVQVRVGPVQKALRVFGPRAWYRGGVGRMELSPPEPFESTPIRWELAFGGSDYETDPNHPLEEPRNPVGTGLVSDPQELIGMPGPNIEDPTDLISTHRSRPRPAGFGPIGRHWMPRRTYTGTVDEQWMEERMPLLPLDFDDRFNQASPPDQITPEPLRGGERVEVLGMHEEGAFAFDLPRLRFFVGVQTKDALSQHPPQLDTVLLHANDRSVELTWRSVVPLPRRAADVRFVQVHEKEWLT
ncbi:MAG: DUF2169 domain-containing protein [Sandaracinaceae bacterium]